MVKEKHPYKVARLEARQTMDSVASKLGVQRLHVVRSEQGLFRDPPSDYTNLLSGLVDLKPPELERAYLEWIRLKRSQLELGSRLTDNFKTYMSREFPKTSQIERAKLLCVHPSTLRSYEFLKIRAMPLQIKEALLDAGLTPGFVDDLAMANDRWYFCYA